MSVFPRFWRRSPGLEHELREHRSEPDPDFVRSLAERIREEQRPARVHARPRLRIAVGGALTAALLAGFAAVGGVGYATTAVKHAAHAVSSLIAAHGPSAVVVGGLNAGGDQYMPGYSWGDPGHNHAGPPGVKRKGGSFAPPLVAHCKGGTARVTTTIVLDEQSDLRVSVLKHGGARLPLLRKGSTVGGPQTGKPTKTIRYRVLVPRAMRISLRIPCSAVQDRATYRIAIKATDPDGNSSALLIPFWAQVPAS